MNKSKSKPSRKRATKPRKQTVSTTVVKVQPPRNSKASNKAKVELVCGYNDPFCKAAIGARYMTMGRVRSLPYASHIRTTLSTDATGRASLLILPNYLNLPFLTSFSITGSAVIPNNFSATSLIAGVESCRLVSFGYIVRSIVSPLNASGMVRIRIFSAPDASMFAIYDGTTYNCDEYQDIPLNRCGELCVILKPLDITSQKFVEPAAIAGSGAGIATWVSPSRQQSTIFVDGGPVSTGVIDVEFFSNWELTFTDSDGTQQLALPGLPLMHDVNDAISTVSSEARSIFKEGVLSVGRYMVSSAARALGGAVASRLGVSSMAALTLT